MREHQHCHIVIVGAGLCGAYLALGLRRILPGARVVVLDKRPLTAPVQPASPVSAIHDTHNAIDTTDATAQVDAATRAIAVAYGSVQFFSRWGLPLPPTADGQEQAAGVGCPVRTVHVSEAGRLGHVSVSAAMWGLPVLGYVFPAAVLNRTVHQALYAAHAADRVARAQSPYAPGLHLHTGVNLTAVRTQYPPPTAAKTGPAISPHVKGAVDVQCEGRLTTYHTELIVGADGTDSFVAAQLGQPWSQPTGQSCLYCPSHTVSEIAQIAWVVEVYTAHPLPVCADTAWERFTPLGPCALLPLSPGRYKCVWTLTQAVWDKWKCVSDNALLLQLQRLCGDAAGRFVRIGSRASYVLQHRYRDPPYQAGAVWVGNAAHTVHPIAAQGFNMGLRDVEGLMLALARAWARGSGLGEVSGLAEYAKGRMADHHWVRQCTRVMNMGYAQPDSGWQSQVSCLRARAFNVLSLCPPLMHIGVRPLLGIYAPPL